MLHAHPPPVKDHEPIRYFHQIGWNPKHFLWSLDNWFMIRHRDTHKVHPYGRLIRESPVIKEFVAQVMHLLVVVGGPILLDILKSRKHGFTTFISVLMFHMAVTMEGFEGAVLSHSGEGCDIVHQMLQSYWKTAKMEERPDLAIDNDEMMGFGLRHREEIVSMAPEDIILDATVRFRTARGLNPMSGASPRLVHINEAGKIKLNPRLFSQFSTSVFDAIPQQGPSFIVAEGTAQGTDNWFHKICEQAQENHANGREPSDGEWRFFFAGAHADLSNRKPVEAGYNWEDWPENDRLVEKKMLAELHVPLEFLRWRRGKIRSSDWNWRGFAEDYPVWPEDPFKATENSVVPMHLLDAADKHVRKDGVRYDVFLSENADAPIDSPPVIFR